MPIMFPETGCEKCRNYWTHPFMEDRDKVMDLLQTNMKLQSRLYQCNHCLAYWEEPNGAYPHGLTVEEVEKLYGFAIIAQNPQSQACRCWLRYVKK